MRAEPQWRSGLPWFTWPRFLETVQGTMQTDAGYARISLQQDWCWPHGQPCLRHQRRYILTGREGGRYCCGDEAGVPFCPVAGVDGCGFAGVDG
jgi:hypothetical protein